jgi:hypothetical protein
MKSLEPDAVKRQRTVAILMFIVPLIASCGPYQALTREYYKAPTTDGAVRPATITGSNDDKSDPSRPVKVFVYAIDGKPVGLPKPARCNFDRLYPVSPGNHTVTLYYAAGEYYTQSLVANAEISFDFEPDASYVAKGQFNEMSMGVMWIENKGKGTVAAERKEYPLKDNPGKGMPVGFAAMSDSCALPI